MTTIEPKDATHVRILIGAPAGGADAGRTYRVREFVPHGGHTDESHQYILETGATVLGSKAEPVPDPRYDHSPVGADATWLRETEEAKLKGDAKTDLPNPKQAYGDKKPPLDEFPLSAMIHAALAHLDGDHKYGFRNWRDYPVEARTYIKGAMRHLRLFEVGEDLTRDTTVHNLGAVIAGCAILIDAQLHGTMIDNRRHSKAEADLLHSAEATVFHLQELQRKRDEAKAQTVAPPEGFPEPGPVIPLEPTMSFRPNGDLEVTMPSGEVLLYKAAVPEDNCYCGGGDASGHNLGCPEVSEPIPEDIPAFIPTRSFPPGADASHHSGEFPDNPAESFSSHLDGDSLQHLKPSAHPVEDTFEAPNTATEPLLRMQSNRGLNGAEDW